MRFQLDVRSALVAVLLSPILHAGEPQRVPVWPGSLAPNGDGGTSEATTTLTIHRPERPNGAAMIICPGGGYGGLVAGPEGHGIAEWLGKHGITGLVLEYRLPRSRSKVPLLDAQRAIRLARANSGAWKIDPDRLGIIGFSAGGHLAATAATRFDAGATEQAADGDSVERFSSRPDFAILIYPVITMGGETHAGSRQNLLGPDPSREMIDAFSAEKQVTGRTPPTFLAHAKDDTVVVPKNSALFAEAMSRHGVPCEHLELESGGHGLNGYQGASWDAWQAASLKWLDSHGFLAGKSSGSGKPAQDERVIPVTEPEVLRGLSPWNWIRSKDAVHTTVCGASWQGSFPGANRVTLNVDTSRLSYSSPERFPILGWSVNGGPVLTHQLAAGENRILLCEDVRNPSIDLFIKGMSPFEDRFTGEVPPNSVTITGFTVPASCKGASAPPSRPLWLNIGDSILSGDAAAYALNQGRPADDRWAGSDDARASYGHLLARHFGHQESRLAFGGYAWTGGLGNNPPLSELVDRITSTTSRLSGDAEKLSPVPQVVLVNLGENGVPPEEAVKAALSKLRQRCSADRRILVMIPVSGRGRAEISAAVANHIRASHDKNTYLVDAGAPHFDTADGQHPTAAGHRAIFRVLVPLVEPWVKHPAAESSQVPE